MLQSRIFGLNARGIDSIVKNTASSSAEQILRSKGDPYSATASEIKFVKTPDSKNTVTMSIEIQKQQTDSDLQDETQVHPNGFDGCNVVLMHLRIPTLNVTFPRLLGKIDHMDLNKVTVLAILSNELRNRLGDLKEITKVDLSNHELQIQPGIFAEVQDIKTSSDENSGGIIVLTTTESEDFMKKFTECCGRNDPFVTINDRTRDRNNELASGRLTAKGNTFYLDTHPYQKGVSNTPQSSVLNIQRIINDSVDGEGAKVLLLRARKSYGLSPLMTDIFKYNIKEAITEPLKDFRDEVNRDIIQKGGAINSLTKNLKNNILYITVGSLIIWTLLSIFSNIATAAITHYVFPKAKFNQKKITSVKFKQVSNGKKNNKSNTRRKKVNNKKIKNVKSTSKKKSNKQLTSKKNTVKKMSKKIKSYINQ